jgi:4-aminobutyrate aminotransferase-like enzyme
VESRNVTYASDRWPIFWERAKGSNVEDVDGNVYVDLTGAFGVALLGHGHPGVMAAVHEQGEDLVHGMGDVHPSPGKVSFLEALAAITPWPEARTVLATSGAEAVEAALKTAHLATGKPGVIAFEGGYHGLTLGALSATSRPHFRRPFFERLYPGVAICPFPDLLRDGDAVGKALATVERALTSGGPNGDPVGAMIIEPVQGRAGARVAPHGFMPALSRLAREAGVLLIADEILTGMGRCGAYFASERVGLRPDIICVGKALGGGLPLSACLAPPAIMDAWPASTGEAIHTSTFLGHPLACAAGEAVLQALHTEAVLQRADVLGGRLVVDLRESLAGETGVADVRGLGLLIGVEFASGPSRTPSVGRAARVAEAALERGLLLLPAGDHGHVLELTPPVDLTEAQIRFSVDAIAQAVRQTG